MIIIKYIVWETLKKQLAILFILLIIFFCLKLVKILSAVIDGEIPINLVISLLWLGLPEMILLILPLSLSLSLLITLGKLHSESEITVMYACGLKKIVLIKAVIVLALFTGFFTAINVTWIGPLSSLYLNKVIAEAKANPGMAVLIQGHFQQANNGSLVLFINNVDGNRFSDIFLAQFDSKENAFPIIVVADSGQLELRKNGFQVVTLNKGTRFEGAAMLRDFRITNFQNCQVIISHQTAALDLNNTELMNIYTLINTNNNSARAELHWRITLIFTAFVMALLAIPLSVMNLRLGYAASMLLAILLYLVFFLLQTLIKSNGSKGKIDVMFWSWTINVFYLILAVILNTWDTILVRRFRVKFIGKRTI